MCSSDLQMTRQRAGGPTDDGKSDEACARQCRAGIFRRSADPASGTAVVINDGWKRPVSTRHAQSALQSVAAGENIYRLVSLGNGIRGQRSGQGNKQPNTSQVVALSMEYRRI